MTTANTFETQQNDAGEHQEHGAGGVVNVGSQERMISAAAGALLALYGLKRLNLRALVLIGVGAMLLRRSATGRCPLYEKLGMSSADPEGARPEEYFERGIHLEESFSINKSPEELYQFWHNFENLPRFMKHLESVKQLDDKRSHWVAQGPLGMSVEWDAEIINDEPNHLIAWRSLPGATVDNAGSVTFRPGAADRGTEVSVTLDYLPPAGKAGSYVAKLFGKDADQMIRADLQNFQNLIETGEIFR